MKSISLILAFIFSMGSGNPGETPYALGDAVQNFELPNVKNGTVSLEQYKDEKGVIVIFSCNECPYMHKYEQRMIDLHNTYAPKGWPVVAISSNDAKRMKGNSFKNMKKRAKELDFPFEYVYDADQQQLRNFGATKTPEVFLLANQNGEFVLQYTGAIDDDPRSAERVEKKYVEEAIAELEAGESISTPKTKAIGCGIRPLKGK